MKVVRYALPLTLLGCVSALHHTLLQLGVIPETLAPCAQGVSCSKEQLALFGFLSIPMLSLLPFASAAILLALSLDLLRPSTSAVPCLSSEFIEQSNLHI